MGLTEVAIGAAGSLLAAALWDELKAWSPRLSKAITRAALRLAPAAQRERLGEEWAAHVDDTPGHLGKIGVSLGFILAATSISRDARRAARPVKGVTRLSTRAADLAFSAMALIWFAPAMLLISLSIKLDGPGPILLAQRRTGQGGQTILVYKFRTLNLHGTEHRVSRVGRFLRITSIDELPQLINVLRGDMNMVGPLARPEHGDRLSDRKPGLVPPELLELHGIKKYLMRAFLGLLRDDDR